MNITEAITGRASTRAFLDKPVARTTVDTILDIARWAPSGTNMQPWLVSVLTGATKEHLSEALIAARRSGHPENPDYRYYPGEWREPYRGRRKACGLALYKALGVSTRDADARMEAWCNNYRFFGAPVGLLFWLDRDLETGSFLDLGMFIQSVMLAARGFGLESGPQASLAEYPDRIREILDVPDSRILVCGLSLGYADPDAPTNQYRTEREPVRAFAQWYD
jgi:nitroreductase